MPSFSLMPFQTCMTYFFLRNTKEALSIFLVCTMKVDGVQVGKISYFVFCKLKNVIEWENNDRVFFFKYTRIDALLSKCSIKSEKRTDFT